jgi:hypothetical protein
MKNWKQYTIPITTIIICSLAFYALIFDFSWKLYPIGFVIGYSLSEAIEKLNRIGK